MTVRAGAGGEDAPVELGASWLLPRDAVGTDLERMASFGRPLYQEVEEITGRRYVNARDVSPDTSRYRHS